ncbi:alpha/beta hydrolase [Microbacterium sp. 2216-1]|uniref:alpha/beta hydrolase n=1 Tax=Microbacterium sp. 2216-1 TaxID=3390053 RepID=UPI003975BF23
MTSRSTQTRTRHWWALDPAGSLVGLAFAVLSITPSLLPRPAVLQGALAGISFAVGYLLGAVVWALVRRLLWRGGTVPPFRPVWWFVYAAIWVAAILGLSGLALDWQNDVRGLVAMPPLDGVNITGFLLSFLLLAVLLLAAGKATASMFGHLRRRIGAVLAAAASAIVVVAVVGGLVFAAVVGVDRIYLARNALPDAEVAEPTSDFHSAGEASPIAWESLGRHGANFVGGGPTAAEITQLTGAPALEPIRVYAGLESAPSIEERADLVVAELERTGAFERSVLVVATATGSGWLEPQTVDALEYLHGGDTAIAAMQYAYTPSWVSFVFDPDAPVGAARALFEAVEQRWLQLPADERPLLVSYGLSLGAHGSQAVFADLDDVRARTDAAMFVGSPNGSSLWRSLQAARDADSPTWQPVLDAGREVRWMSRAGDEDLLTGPWEQPRVLYLQHANDPVTWLSPELLFRSPEWLESAQRSSDVSASMRWIPVVTGLQVTVDMLGGEAVPAQHGHNYGDVVVTGWRQVTGDATLSPEAIERIQAEIETYAPISSYTE